MRSTSRAADPPAPGDVPASWTPRPDGPSDALLKTVLADHLAVTGTRPATSIGRIARRPSPERTSAALEEIDVERVGGEALALVLKDTSRAAMHDEARRVKPRAVHDPRREIETYRRVLPHHAPGTAACYGSVIDEAAGHYWLLLERVPGIPLWQTDDPAAWQAAARWLAGAHATFARAGVAGRAHEVHAIRCDAAYYRQWMVRARRLLRFETGERAAKLAWLSSRHGDVIPRLVSLPTTFIHGEFYASNVLVQQSGGMRRVCPVDWEMAGVGPGLLDLAALTAGRWPDPERLAIAGAYRDELDRQGMPWPDDGDFVEALNCCRVQIAVQWLGWFGNRPAPAAHTQDWLEAAVCLAARLAV